MSSSAERGEDVFALPVTTLEYCDMAGQLISDGANTPVAGTGYTFGNRRRTDIDMTAEEFAERIKQERADAAQQTEQRLRQEYDAKLQAVRAPIAAALAAFEVERGDYYSRVESEIVQLSLSIAAKILHREAQVDPMLVAALVRITIEKMREGSSVTVRVGPSRAKQWKEYFAGQSAVHRVTVVEDAELNEYDCLLETDLGTTNLGLNTQLKEIEKGFFDLLALRPTR